MREYGNSYFAFFVRYKPRNSEKYDKTQIYTLKGHNKITKTRLKKYANLIARCGVNVQKGQEVYITAELDQPEFVQMVVDECYKAGAKKVTVDFSYGPLTRSHVKY